MPSNSLAETLREALFSAYRLNPELMAQRASVVAAREIVTQAESQRSPSLSFQSRLQYDRSHLSDREREQSGSSNVPKDIEQNGFSTYLILSKPLFTSGRISATIDAAEAESLASVEALRTTENNIMFSVVAAYSDVLRDDEVLRIRETNLQMLIHQVNEAKARHRAGELTKTDVAQADAQLAAERALVTQANGQLEISKSSYLAVVGHAPELLEALPQIDGLPLTFEDCLRIAERSNPDLRQAKYLEISAAAKVRIARSNGRPTISAEVQKGLNGPLSPYDRHSVEQQLSVTATIVAPIYSGGLFAAQTREAKARHNTFIYNVESVSRTTNKILANIWSQRRVANDSLTFRQQQVDAARVAFEGSRKEYSVGDRSTLDVLVAEETLREAEIAVVSTRHDLYLAEAAILQHLGWLEAANLITGERAVSGFETDPVSLTKPVR